MQSSTSASPEARAEMGGSEDPSILGKVTTVLSIASLQELLLAFSQLTAQPNQWLFRGQPDVNWGFSHLSRDLLSRRRVVLLRSSNTFGRSLNGERTTIWNMFPISMMSSRGWR